MTGPINLTETKPCGKFHRDWTLPTRHYCVNEWTNTLTDSRMYSLFEYTNIIEIRLEIVWIDVETTNNLPNDRMEVH